MTPTNENYRFLVPFDPNLTPKRSMFVMGKKLKHQADLMALAKCAAPVTKVVFDDDAAEV